jgi:hypothetical protein
MNVEEFVSYWENQAVRLSKDQKDKMGIAYLKYALGTDESLLGKFLQKDLAARVKIGLRLGDVEKYTPDYHSFWEEIKKIDKTDFYSESRIEFLCGDSFSSFRLLLCIQPFHIKEQPWSSVINDLLLLAHTYK